MAPRRPKIVHLITRLELGGAQQNTLYCARHHDRARFSVGLWAGQIWLLMAWLLNLTLIGLPGRLRTAKGHMVSSHHLGYHRSHYGPSD
jgi:hypothetical protein